MRKATTGRVQHSKNPENILYGAEFPTFRDNAKVPGTAANNVVATRRLRGDTLHRSELALPSGGRRPSDPWHVRLDAEIMLLVRRRSAAPAAPSR